MQTILLGNPHRLHYSKQREWCWVSEACAAAECTSWFLAFLPAARPRNVTFLVAGLSRRTHANIVCGQFVKPWQTKIHAYRIRIFWEPKNVFFKISCLFFFTQPPPSPSSLMARSSLAALPSLSPDVTFSQHSCVPSRKYATRSAWQRHPCFYNSLPIGIIYCMLSAKCSGSPWFHHNLIQRGESAVHLFTASNSSISIEWCSGGKSSVGLCLSRFVICLYLKV